MIHHRHISSFFVFLNLVCYLLFVNFFYNQTIEPSNGSISTLFFIFALQAVATYGNIIANGKTTMIYFSTCISTISWILILLLVDIPLAHIFSTILMSMYPLFIIIFFFSLFEKKYLSKYRFFLLIQFFIGIMDILIYFFLRTPSYYTLSFLACYICCFVLCFLIYHKNFKDSRFRKNARVLLLSFVGGFSPFLLFHIFPTYILGLEGFKHFYWTLYLLLIFPITALILFEKFETTPKNHLVFTIFSNISIFLGFFFVMDVVVYYVISPQLTSLLRLNSVTLFIVYATYHIIQWRFEIREQKLASDITLFSDQKTNISYQLLSNEQFESMAKIISDVFLHSYEFTGIAFVWSENNNPPYFLFKKKSLVNLNHTFINNHNLFTDVDKKVINYKNEHVLVIPMMEINQVIGLIIVSKEKNKPFSQVELDELTKNAEEIAIFLRTSEQRLTVEKMLSTQYYSEFERAAYIRQHDLAQEDKKKLANYLHDNVLQTILAVKNLNLSIESNDLKTIELIDQTLKSLSVSMRDYMTQIYPSFLSVLPLENSFINLAKNLEIFYQLGIEINWHIEKNLPLTETQKVFFYRIVKELLTNAYKHSKANKIEVDLHQQDNNIILRVTDDGSGIKSNQLDDEQFYTTHLGLLSIKQEVDYKNGTLDIYSGRNIGTEIKISIPTARGTKS